MKKAFFLDRDGVINVEISYLGSPDKVELLPGTAAAISKIHRAGFLAVVVTNQSGVARQMYTQEDVTAVHARMQRILLASGREAALDAFYCCFHHPAFNGKCSCRKPEPGMLLSAAKDLKIDLAGSFMIGDKMSDLAAGSAAGCQQSVLVSTGYGREKSAEAEAAGFLTAASLEAAVDLLLQS